MNILTTLELTMKKSLIGFLVVTSLPAFSQGWGNNGGILNTSNGSLRGDIRNSTMTNNQRVNDQIQQRLGHSEAQRDQSRLLGNGGGVLNTSDGSLRGDIRNSTMTNNQRVNDNIQQRLGYSEAERDQSRLLGNGGGVLNTSDGSLRGDIRNSTMTNNQRVNDNIQQRLGYTETERDYGAHSSSTYVPRSDVHLDLGESYRAEGGEVISCAGGGSIRPSSSSACKRVSRIYDNEEFRIRARAGFGACSVNSQEVSSGYICFLTLNKDASGSIFTTRNDPSCYSLFDELKDMAASGELESLCGSCD